MYSNNPNFPVIRCVSICFRLVIKLPMTLKGKFQNIFPNYVQYKKSNTIRNQGNSREGERNSIPILS